MKLKYYLRGMGIGIILTAIVMGFALGGRKTTISDAEVIERARALGMIDGKGVLDAGTDSSEVSLDDSLTPGSALVQEGTEISQEIDQEFSSSDESVSDMANEEKKTEDKNSESANASEQISQAGAGTAKSTDSKPDESIKEEDTAVAEEIAAANKTDTKTDSKTENKIENKTESKVDNKAENKTGNKTADNSTADNSTAGNSSNSTDNTASEQPKTLQTIGSKTTVTKTVTIPNGLGSEGVSRVLYNSGVIDDAVTFNNYLVERKMDRGIRAGVKTFPAGSSYEDIARIICQG